MNEAINNVLKFIRGSMNARRFEEWVYSYKNLEEELSPNIFMKIIGLPHTCDPKRVAIRVAASQMPDVIRNRTQKPRVHVRIGLVEL